MKEMSFLLCSNTICSQSCLTNHIAAQLSLGETLFKGMALQGKMVLTHLHFGLLPIFVLLGSYNNKSFAPRFWA